VGLSTGLWHPKRHYSISQSFSGMWWHFVTVPLVGPRSKSRSFPLETGQRGFMPAPFVFRATYMRDSQSINREMIDTLSDPHVLPRTHASVLSASPLQAHRQALYSSTAVSKRTYLTPRLTISATDSPPLWLLRSGARSARASPFTPSFPYSPFELEVRGSCALSHC